MAAQHQVFVRLLDGSTRCVHFEEEEGNALQQVVTVGALKNAIQAEQGIPREEQKIVSVRRCMLISLSTPC